MPALELAARRLYAIRMSFEHQASVRWQTAAVLLLAAVLRLWSLDLRPPHFDEGVNGWFADQMTRQGYYRYDPTNYHGPLHFYFVFVSQTLLGRNLWALRLPAVLASVLAVWAMLRLAAHFGPAARLAALAMAVSPGFVYYGRYSIHESWLAFFLLLSLGGILGIWRDGRKRDLWQVAAGLTGMVLTKETYVIHVAGFLLAFPCLWLWERVVPSRPGLAFARQQWNRRDLGTTVAVALAVIVAFYSGFFLDFGALRGLYETFAAWVGTGVEAAGHEKPEYQFGPLNFYWLALMARYEPVALAGFAGCFAALWPCDARLRYTAISAAGVLLAYSVIPYKTPWCVAAIAPLFLPVAAGMIARLPRSAQAVLWLILLGLSTFGAIRLNFFHYAADDELYTYVQTYPELDDAIRPLLAKAREDPRFYAKPGAVVMESYYPLPWLLGDFTSVGYYSEKDVPKVLPSAFVLSSEEAAEEVQAALRGEYLRVPFRLRSGADRCVAFFRVEDFEGRVRGERVGSP